MDTSASSPRRWSAAGRGFEPSLALPLPGGARDFGLLRGPRRRPIGRLALVGCVLLSAWGVVPLGVAWAAEEPPKIGYVDLARLFDGYERTQRSEAALQEKGKAKEQEFQQRLDELKTLREGLGADEAPGRDTTVRAIEEKADALKRFRTNVARDLRQERDEIAVAILEEIRVMVEAFAKEHGYAFILDARSVLYGQPGQDVTDALLAKLNERNTPER